MRFSALRGTYDLLPDEVDKWHHVEAVARKHFRAYGYREIRTPLIEETRLFQRSTGDSTDIVTKEMYTFNDRRGRSISLRPEGTPSIVRAYVQHKISTRGSLAKLYYMGAMFRYERPQAGRNRQFHQMGAEAIGSQSPGVDHEVVQLAWELFGKFGLKQLTLKLNSLGCPSDRKSYSQALRSHFADRETELCGDCVQRLKVNPLRVLDCKVDKCKDVALSAPKTIDYLCAECLHHQRDLERYLDGSRIGYELDPYLVRGLDYYTRTVFEIHHPGLGARSAICGGGRYDSLVEQIGGPPTPAVGFSLGTEATILVMEKEGVLFPRLRPAEVYVCCLGKEAYEEGLRVAICLRARDIPTELDHEGRSLKAQMKEADKLHVRYAVIIGEDELKNNSVTLREMSTGNQESVSVGELGERVETDLNR